MTPEELKIVCIEYDKFYENYPESEFEGLSILNFFRKKLNLPKITMLEYEKELKVKPKKPGEVEIK